MVIPFRRERDSTGTREKNYGYRTPPGTPHVCVGETEREREREKKKKKKKEEEEKRKGKGGTDGFLGRSIRVRHSESDTDHGFTVSSYSAATSVC